MNWDNIAPSVLNILGEPIRFLRNDILIIELNGIHLSEQELRKSKTRSLRLIDCDIVTIPYTNLLKSGDTVDTGKEIYRIAGDPKRDGSGGLIVKLESSKLKKVDGRKWIR